MTRIYTRPTPTAKGPSPSQPDAGSLEQQAREWAEKIIAPNKLYDGAISFWDTTSPNGIPMNCGNFTDTRTPGHLRSAMVRILTAFATQHAASLEARVKFTESIAAINKSTADAMEARALAAERKADALTAKCAAQAATIAAERKAYSELRFQHTKLESRFSTVKQHLQLWNDATTNIAANQAMSNAFEEATK